jgi:thioesterase domain-containing protein
VVLVGRSGPAAAGVAVLAAGVAGAGSAVAVVACDIAERASVRALLTWIGASGPRLSAVLHAAVSIGLASLAETGIAGLTAGLAAKVAGAAVLDELTAGLELDAFVLFSSIAGVWGSSVHGPYAAGNAYLDALASHRRGRGQAATSVAWGVWDAGWVRGGGPVAAGLRRQGLAFLDPGRALAVLEQVLADDETFIAVADVDWAHFAPAFTVRRPSPLIGDLPEVRQALAAGDGSAATAGAQTSLARRLAGLPRAGQETLLTDLVRAEAAAVLGHPSPEAVGANAGFLELGLDSLTAVELRNRLNAVSGLRLPATAVFDHPTSLLLARHLRAELSAAGLLPGTGSPRNGDDSPPNGDDGRRYTASGDTVPAADTAPTRFLGGLYAQAARAGRAGEIMRLIQGLATFRPTFAGPAELGAVPGPVPVCRGPAGPGMIFFPSFVGRPQEYARLARGFRGIREVSVIPAPGFAAAEPLPATAGALIALHAQTIASTAGGAPFVLAGHSSGGLVAHAVATHLQNAGQPPAAIVLLDTFTPEKTTFEEFRSRLPEIVLTDGEQREDAWLTAMVHYFWLDWTGLDETALPTLLVRPDEPLSGSPGQAGRPPSWAFSSNVTIVEVPGSHFSMMADHADTTAQAVNDWLAGL